jgi:hypothetical protein
MGMAWRALADAYACVLPFLRIFPELTVCHLSILFLSPHLPVFTHQRDDIYSPALRRQAFSSCCRVLSRFRFSSLGLASGNAMHITRRSLLRYPNVPAPLALCTSLPTYLHQTNQLKPDPNPKPHLLVLHSLILGWRRCGTTHAYFACLRNFCYDVLLYRSAWRRMK